MRNEISHLSKVIFWDYL